MQILTGFLLTLPFTQRFERLDHLQRGAYLAVLSGSVLATALLVAPVAFHRVLFRRSRRPWIVAAANRSALAGLVMLALTTSGVIWLVFDVVVERWLASVAGVVSLVLFALLWVGVPMRAAGDPADPS